MHTNPLLDRHVLVLDQQSKVLEFYSEYDALDEHGAYIEAVTETRSAALASRLRLGGDVEALLPVTLELRDASKLPVLRMSKPWGWPVTRVARGDGTYLGCVRRQWRPGKTRFELVGNDGQVGQVRARNWRRATDFSVVDATRTELARAEKLQRVERDHVPGPDAGRYLIRIQEHALNRCAASP